MTEPGDRESSTLWSAKIGIAENGPISKASPGCTMWKDAALEICANLLIIWSRHSFVQNILKFVDSSTLLRRIGKSLMWSSCAWVNNRAFGIWNDDFGWLNPSSEIPFSTLLTMPSPMSTSIWKILFVSSFANIEQEVFAVILVRFTSAALSDFSSLPSAEIFGSTPFILTINCAPLVEI